MRQQVAQTRASCAHEVRKRDRQIDGLKKAVSEAGRARGERRNPAITTITITGGDSAHQHHQQQQQQQQTPRSAVAPSAQSTPKAAAPDYDLRAETNAFLAELARGLSEDNEVLLDLVRHTSRRLKAMSGYVGDGAGAGAGGEEDASSSAVVDCGALAVEMESVLEHLRTILTNPSFVPIEEVVVRESEIGRLRDGWTKMEGRWKEAVHLLDGWRRRMAVSGRPVNMEEIKMGLRLSPVRVRNVAETSMGLDLRRPLRHEGLAEDEAEAEEDSADESEGGEAQDMPPLGRSPSPAETLHLVPAPDTAGYEPGYEPGHTSLSDSESDTSSIFADNVDDDQIDRAEDEPNVQIIEQSLLSSYVASPTPAAFSRSTPSPSPPPPEKPALSKVTAAAIQEKKREKKTQQGLRPSQTAANRGGAGAASSDDVKKETATAATTTTAAIGAMARGRPQQKEMEAVVKERKHVRIAAPAPAAEKPRVKPAGPRATTSTTTGPGRANAARASAKTASTRPGMAERQGKPAPSRPVSALAQREKPRPASAASQASDASTASAASSSTASDDNVSLVPSHGTATTTAYPASPLASRKPAAAAVVSTARSRLDRTNRPASEDKTSAHAPATSTTSTSSEHMPPPPAPSSMPSAASRTRSRSPVKAAATSSAAATTTSAATATALGGVTSRLPLPTATGMPPPASPALSMATIAAKLAASEREADAARVRAKLKAARSGGLLGTAKGKAAAAGGPAAEPDNGVNPIRSAGDSKANVPTTSVGAPGDQQPQQQQPLRKKRDAKDKDQRRVSKAASRRRSTLNPWELKSLMTGSVEGVEGAASVDEAER